MGLINHTPVVSPDVTKASSGLGHHAVIIPESHIRYLGPMQSDNRFCTCTAML
jgi:hypothetical protein